LPVLRPAPASALPRRVGAACGTSPSQYLWDDSSAAVFRYLLVRPDGEVTDPAVFMTDVPTWKLGDVFQIGDGSRWRLLAVEADIDLEFVAHGINAIWWVEPADDAPPIP
jgi:hypothetical protein